MLNNAKERLIESILILSEEIGLEINEDLNLIFSKRKVQFTPSSYLW